MKLVGLAFVLLAACGGGSKPAPTEPAAAATDEAATPTEAAPPAEPATCEDLCTSYAICYEEVYGGDYRGGGECVADCESKAPADRDAWAAKVNGGDCKALMAE